MRRCRNARRGDFAKFDVTCRQALEVRCDMRSGRYLLAHGFCKRRVRSKFNSRRELAFNLNFILVDLLLNFIIAGAAD